MVKAPENGFGGTCYCLGVAAGAYGARRGRCSTPPSPTPLPDRARNRPRATGRPRPGLVRPRFASDGPAAAADRRAGPVVTRRGRAPVVWAGSHLKPTCAFLIAAVSAAAGTSACWTPARRGRSARRGAPPSGGGPGRREGPPAPRGGAASDERPRVLYSGRAVCRRRGAGCRRASHGASAPRTAGAARSLSRARSPVLCNRGAGGGTDPGWPGRATGHG